MQTAWLSAPICVAVTISLPAWAQPTWQTTPVAAQFHQLRVGQPMTVDLTDYCTDAERFAVITTSREYDEPLLPGGLTLNNSGAISGTPTQTGVYALRVRAYSGAETSEASWALRSANSLNAERFMDEASVSLVSDVLSGTPEYSQWDPSAVCI